MKLTQMQGYIQPWYWDPAEEKEKSSETERKGFKVIKLRGALHDDAQLR